MATPRTQAASSRFAAYQQQAAAAGGKENAAAANYGGFPPATPDHHHHRHAAGAGIGAGGAGGYADGGPKFDPYSPVKSDIMKGKAPMIASSSRAGPSGSGGDGVGYGLDAETGMKGGVGSVAGTSGRLSVGGGGGGGSGSGYGLDAEVPTTKAAGARETDRSAGYGLDEEVKTSTPGAAADAVQGLGAVAGLSPVETRGSGLGALVK